MNRNLLESVLGGVVLIVAAVFLWFFYNTTHIQTADGYHVTAQFATVSGLQPGSDVRVNGITVGTVVERHLTPDFFADVTLNIDRSVKLPVDTVAVITGDGLLGGNYVGLKPGKATEYLADGQRLKNTQDFKTIEDQVGEIIFLATGSEGGGKGL